MVLPAAVLTHFCVFSSGRLCICSWTPWMLRLLTTCAASNPTTSKRPSRESARLVFYLNQRKWSEVVHAESVQNADEFIVAQPNRTSRSDITEVMTNRFCMGVRTSTCSNRIHFQLNSYLFKQKKTNPKNSLNQTSSQTAPLSPNAASRILPQQLTSKINVSLTAVTASSAAECLHQRDSP